MLLRLGFVWPEIPAVAVRSDGPAGRRCSRGARVSESEVQRACATPTPRAVPPRHDASTSLQRAASSSLPLPLPLRSSPRRSDVAFKHGRSMPGEAEQAGAEPVVHPHAAAVAGDGRLSRRKQQRRGRLQGREAAGGGGGAAAEEERGFGGAAVEEGEGAADAVLHRAPLHPDARLLERARRHPPLAVLSSSTRSLNAAPASPIHIPCMMPIHIAHGSRVFSLHFTFLNSSTYFSFSNSATQTSPADRSIERLINQ